MKYVLYIKQTCPLCVKAQEFLEKQGKNFKIINFEEAHQDILENIKKAYDWPTVPMIFEVGDKISFLGGYTDLIKYFDGH
mgnify:CR=1 FL=1|jgi:glutaredoxin